MPEIRPIALCLFRNRGRILVFEVRDGGRLIGYRPLGGGIEFGETSRDAVVREIREELGIELREPTLVTVLENLFTYGGQPKHEIVFVYDGLVGDASVYDRDDLMFDEGNERIPVRWVDPHDLDAPLFPNGLADAL
ncbi:MAG: NUDIX hydrolase [Kofleriaceae bacterium]